MVHPIYFLQFQDTIAGSRTHAPMEIGGAEPVSWGSTPEKHLISKIVWILHDFQYSKHQEKS